VGALNSLSGAMAISEVTVQHIGFALESSQRYYILESGRVTSSGTGGSASEADVRAAMAI
jgi:urea transport system ATP-binding protein